jgi:hypothetical protein
VAEALAVPEEGELDCGVASDQPEPQVGQAVKKLTRLADGPGVVQLRGEYLDPPSAKIEGGDDLVFASLDVQLE